MDYSRYPKEHHLLVDIQDGVALLTMNRPEKRNAVNYALHAGLEAIFRDAGRDPDVDVIVLTGAGDKAFSAGGDVKNFGFPTERTLDHLRSTRNVIQEMVNCEAPIVAAVNGFAVGFGATLALLSDVIFMADTASIGDTHVKAGLVAGDGGQVIWPLLIGPHRAKECLLTGRLLSALEADSMGLVNHVVPADRVLDEALTFARALAELDTTAVRFTKMAINQHILHSVNLSLGVGASFEHLGSRGGRGGTTGAQEGGTTKGTSG